MIRRAVALVAACVATAGCKGGASGSVVGFDGSRAIGTLAKQVAFGPRVPGTAAHDSCAAWLLGELRAVADSTWTQAFTGTMAGEPRTMRNLLAAQRPHAASRVLLLAHWDSRPWADEDPDPARRRMPVAGANDGASGVAVVLELARTLRAQAPAVGVDIALVDGEDLGSDAAPQLFSQGARALVSAPGFRRPDLVLLFDMVGDVSLSLERETSSWQSAPRQMRDLWAVGRKMYPEVWLDQQGSPMIDDHLPFIDAGIPAIDIIDFAYPFWHTTSDTPDKCSAASLEAVGRPVLAYIHTLK